MTRMLVWNKESFLMVCPQSGKEVLINLRMGFTCVLKNLEKSLSFPVMENKQTFRQTNQNKEFCQPSLIFLIFLFSLNYLFKILKRFSFCFYDTNLLPDDAPLWLFVMFVIASSSSQSQHRILSVSP